MEASFSEHEISLLIVEVVCSRSILLAIVAHVETRKTLHCETYIGSFFSMPNVVVKLHAKGPSDTGIMSSTPNGRLLPKRRLRPEETLGSVDPERTGVDQSSDWFDARIRRDPKSIVVVWDCNNQWRITSLWLKLTALLHLGVQLRRLFL